MAFPNYKTKKGWLFSWKIEDDWEDLGEADEKMVIKDGINTRAWTVHNLCNTAVRIGKENGEPFQFCPRCMVKTTKYTA